MDTLFTDIIFWHWLILGVILLMMELTSGSGFLLWVSIGCFISSIVSFIFPSIDWPWQFLLFSTFSVCACILWWHYLKRCTEANDKPNLNQRTNNYIGRVFELETAIENGRGKVKIGDTFWLVEGADLPVQTKVKVTAVDGTLLKVEEHKE